MPLVALVLLVAALSAPATAAAAEAAPCRLPANATVVAESAAAVVTREETHGFARWVGCLRATGRRLELAAQVVDEKTSSSADGFVTAGDFVVFAVTTDGYQLESAAFMRVDLRTAQRQAVDGGGGYEQSTPRLTEAVVDADGTVAFVRRDGDAVRLRLFVAGRTRDVERGPAEGLRLEPGRLRWRAGGAEREQAFVPTCPARAGVVPVRRTDALVVTRRTRAPGRVAEYAVCSARTGRTRVVTARRPGTPAVQIDAVAGRVALVRTAGREQRLLLAGADRGTLRTLDRVVRRPDVAGITDVAVTGRGTVTWIRGEPGGRVVLSVRRPDGHVLRVARGRRGTLDLREFDDEVVRWTAGGRQRSRRFAPGSRTA